MANETVSAVRRRRWTKAAAPAEDTAAGQAIGRDRAPSIAAGGVTAAMQQDERIVGIAITASVHAEARRLNGGSPEQDWLEAKAEIDLKPGGWRT